MMMGGATVYQGGLFAIAMGWIPYPESTSSGFAGYHEIMDRNNGRNLIDGQLSIPADVWDLGYVDWGTVIDNAPEIKNNLGHNFPIVDRIADRVLESTKSYELSCDTYQNASQWLTRLKADIRKLASFVDKYWNGVSIDESMYDSKRLNVVIPNMTLSPAQYEALQQAIEYARNLGIEVRVYTTK